MRRTRTDDACSERNFRAWSRRAFWSAEKSKFMGPTIAPAASVRSSTACPTRRLRGRPVRPPAALLHVDAVLKALGGDEPLSNEVQSRRQDGILDGELPDAPQDGLRLGNLGWRRCRYDDPGGFHLEKKVPSIGDLTIERRSLRTLLLDRPPLR